MTKKIFMLLYCCSILLACSRPAPAPAPYIRLDYKDFGPPAMAATLLGSDFWQWDDHGDSRPRDYPIGVIVYRGIDLARIQQLFPVIQAKEQDYRYVDYAQATDYLNHWIQEVEANSDDLPPTLLTTLKNTRDRIESTLGDAPKKPMTDKS